MKMFADMPNKAKPGSSIVGAKLGISDTSGAFIEMK